MISIAMSQVPALPPPSGIIPNFDDPPSQKKVLLIVNGISISLMLICSALQTYAKIYIIGSPFGFIEAATGLAVVGAFYATWLYTTAAETQVSNYGSLAQYVRQCLPATVILSSSSSNISNFIQ